MLDLHSWLLLAGLCLLGAMAPGVSLAVVTHHTLRGSWRAGVSAALAHCLGVGVYAVATVAGLATLLNHFPQLTLVIRAFGTVFLLWLAVKSWRAAGGPAPEPADTPAHGRAARDGFLIAFLNPKVALFFLALFSQFISPSMDTTARVQIAATAVVIDGGWYSLVAIMLARGRLLDALRRHHDRVERLTAVVLVIAAVAVWV